MAFGCTGRERGCGVSTNDVCCSHTLGRGKQSSEPDQPAADLHGWAVTSVHCNCVRLPQAPDSPSQVCLQFPRQFRFFCSEQILCPFSAEVVRLWQPQFSRFCPPNLARPVRAHFAFAQGQDQVHKPASQRLLSVCTEPLSLALPRATERRAGSHSLSSTTAGVAPRILAFP